MQTDHRLIRRGRAKAGRVYRAAADSIRPPFFYGVAYRNHHDPMTCGPHDGFRVVCEQ